MPKIREVYKCALCGNIIEILHAGSCVPVCCDQPMELVEEGVIEASKEKHIPVIEKIEGGYKVTVGEVAHPMIDKHFIQWIELLTENSVLRTELTPKDAPEAVFFTSSTNVSARAYCNLHGLWKAEYK
ncbi:MAG: desulfoferrodoxin [Desulfovibrio sp.]|nr:desulfoferrodoxin [Desulfovibrio sp.]